MASDLVPNSSTIATGRTPTLYPMCSSPAEIGVATMVRCSLAPTFFSSSSATQPPTFSSRTLRGTRARSARIELSGDYGPRVWPYPTIQKRARMAGWAIDKDWVNALFGDREKSFENAVRLVFSLGDTLFNDPSHHGEPQFRAAMVAGGPRRPRSSHASRL